MVNKDSLDGVVHDDVAKVSERTLDTSVAPARIFLRHLDDELFDLFEDAWPTAASGVGPFPGDQLSMPA